MNMADHTEDNDPFEEDIVFDEAGLLGGKMPRSRQQSTAGFLPTFMLFIRTVCLCIAFLGLGLCVSVSGGPLMRLEMETGVTVNLALQTFTARSVGMLIGAFLGSVLFEVYNRQFLMFVSLVWVAVSITMLPFTVHSALWWTFVTTAALGMGLGFLFTGGNVLCLDLWGRQGGASLQALHFSFAVGAFIVPLVMQPFFVGMHTNSNNPSAPQVYNNGSFSTHMLISTPATQLLIRQTRDINFSNNNNNKHNNKNILDSISVSHNKQKLLRFERDLETRKADVKMNTTTILGSLSEEKIKQLTLPQTDRQANTQTVAGGKQANTNDKQANKQTNKGKQADINDKQANKQTSTDKEADIQTNTDEQETKHTNTDTQTQDISSQTDQSNEKPLTESQTTQTNDYKTTTIDYSENINLPRNLSITSKPVKMKPAFTNGNHLERDDPNSWKNQPDIDDSNPNSSADSGSSQVGETGSKVLLSDTQTTQTDSDQQTTTTDYAHTQQGLTTVPTLPTHTPTMLQTQKEETYSISSVQETTTTTTTPTATTPTTTTPTTTTTPITTTPTTATPTTATPTTTIPTTTATISTTILTNSGIDITFPVDMAEPESMDIPQPEAQNVRENPIQNRNQLEMDDSGGNVMNLHGIVNNGENVMNQRRIDDSRNVNNVESTPSHSHHSSKPGTFSIGPDENSKVLDNVAQKLKDYGVTKVHLAYICIGIFIILNALISVVILCHNPRETRSKQDDGMNKMQKGRIIVFTAIFSVFMFMSEALQGAVHHLLASSETDSGLDIIRESKIDGQALFWGLVCLVRFLCILASGCLRVKPGKLLTASVLFALIGSIFMAIGSFGKEDFLWGGIVFQALGLAPILPTSLLWMAQYMRVTHRMCALMIVLASFGNSLSHSLLTRVASQSEVYAFILVLLSFVCLFFLLVSVCVMYSAQRSKSLGIPVGYQLASQHEEEDSIELTPSGSAVFTPQDTRVRENGEAGQSLLID